MVETFEDLNELETLYENFAKQVEQVSAGCRQGGIDLSSAVNMIRRRQQNELNDKEKQIEKAELGEMQKKSKELAAKIQAQKNKTASSYPIFLA